MIISDYKGEGGGGFMAPEVQMIFYFLGTGHSGQIFSVQIRDFRHFQKTLDDKEKICRKHS
jgi:hypothetical protein